MTIKTWIPGQSVQESQAQQGLPTTGATATGTNQATAYQCPTDFVVFTTTPSGSGCKVLGAVDQGTVNGGAPNGPATLTDTMTIVNHGANALLVYPQTGGTIQNGSVNAGLSVAANKVCNLTYVGNGAWAAAIGN